MLTLVVTKPCKWFINRDSWLWRDLHRLVKSLHQRLQESNTFDALGTRTVICLVTEELRRTDKGNIAGKFQLAHSPLPQALSTFRANPSVNSTEVKKGSKQMKSGNAAEPGVVAAELLLQLKRPDFNYFLSRFIPFVVSRIIHISVLSGTFESTHL